MVHRTPVGPGRLGVETSWAPRHGLVAHDGLADQLRGPPGRFGDLNGAGDGVAAEGVDDDVGVIPDGFDRSGRVGNSPGEHPRRAVASSSGTARAAWVACLRRSPDRSFSRRIRNEIRPRSHPVPRRGGAAGLRDRLRGLDGRRGRHGDGATGGRGRARPGPLGFSDVKVGHVYRMALPLTRNTSKQPVTLGMGIQVCSRTMSVLMRLAGIHGLPGLVRVKRLCGRAVSATGSSRSSRTASDDTHHWVIAPSSSTNRSPRTTPPRLLVGHRAWSPNSEADQR